MLTRILATTALALALATPAMAQQQSDRQSEPQRSEPSEQRRGPGEQRSEQSPDERPTNQLTLADSGSLDGSQVRNQQGEKIGEIEDLVIDIKQGQLAYAIVGVGGFLGLGEKSVAVPWGRLQPTSEAQSFVMNVDRQTLESAPAVDTENLAQLDDPQSRQQISSFWQRAESQQAETPQSPRQPSESR